MHGSCRTALREALGISLEVRQAAPGELDVLTGKQTEARVRRFRDERHCGAQWTSGEAGAMSVRHLYDRVFRVEDLVPGTSLRTASRTILESDIHQFCQLMGDMAGIHMSRVAAAESRSGSVIAPGPMVLERRHRSDHEHRLVWAHPRHFRGSRRLASGKADVPE